MYSEIKYKRFDMLWILSKNNIMIHYKHKKYNRRKNNNVRKKVVFVFDLDRIEMFKI